MLVGTVRVLSRRPDSEQRYEEHSDNILIVDVLIKRAKSLTTALVNHLNQDHVHEVEGRESDGKVEASGQGPLSRPQLHLLRLLEASSHQGLRQP